MKVYVALDIGCIECLEDSAILGVFESDDNANSIVERMAEKQEVNWRGQHEFTVKTVETNVEYTPEYS